MKLKAGTIYSLSRKKIADHSGFADDDAHVGWLVSTPRLKARTIISEVRTCHAALEVVRHAASTRAMSPCVGMGCVFGLPSTKLDRFGLASSLTASTTRRSCLRADARPGSSARCAPSISP
jgi:hypothetical protein